MLGVLLENRCPRGVTGTGFIQCPPSSRQSKTSFSWRWRCRLKIQKPLHRQWSLLPWGTVKTLKYCELWSLPGTSQQHPNSILSWLLLITQMRLRLRSAWSLVVVPSGRNRSGIDLAKLRTEKEPLHLRSGRQSLPLPPRGLGPTWRLSLLPIYQRREQSQVLQVGGFMPFLIKVFPFSSSQIVSRNWKTTI